MLRTNAPSHGGEGVPQDVLVLGFGKEGTNNQPENRQHEKEKEGKIIGGGIAANDT